MRLIRFRTTPGRWAKTIPKKRKICCDPKTKFIRFKRTQMSGQRGQRRFLEQTAQRANPRIRASRMRRKAPVNQIATRLSVPRSEDPESDGDSSWVQLKSKHPYCARTVFKGHKGGVSGVAQFSTLKILHWRTNLVTYFDSHFILRMKQAWKKKSKEKVKITITDVNSRFKRRLVKAKENERTKTEKNREKKKKVSKLFLN